MYTHYKLFPSIKSQKCITLNVFFSAKFFNLDTSAVNSMTTDELKAKVEHEKLYDETDMAQIEGDIRSGIPKNIFEKLL